jgi:tetratricopeptide (TPR) repeat protein
VFGRKKIRTVTHSAKAFPVQLGFLTLAMILFFGCVPPGKVCRVQPPEVGWEGIRDVAVLGFDGPYGENLRRQVCSRLADVQYFNPKHTSQALAHISFDKAGSLESLQALEALGADAVITGLVTVDMHNTHGIDQVEVKEGTGYYKKGKDASGRWVDVEIQRAVIRAVPYVMREARLASEFKVVDVVSHVIIAAGKVTEIECEKFGGDKEYASLGRRLSDLPTSSGTAEKLSGRAAIKLVAELSRMKLGSVLKLDPGENTLVRRGVALAKNGDWEQAVHTWEQVIRDKPDEAAAYYNLGVAHESLGDMKNLRTARDLYEKAANYGTKGLYADGILRVDRVISDSDTD